MLRINDDWIDQMTTEVARWLNADADTDLRPRLAATAVNARQPRGDRHWVADDRRSDLVAAMPRP